MKRVIRECVLCKRLNRLAFAYPKLTDLSKERVRLLKPFNDTAIDYTGHVYVYEGDGTARKVYIVLYTCMAIRAIHLDLVPDLTVKSFIQSFRRFCSAHCVPQSIYTDNARYFLASQRVLNNLFLSDEFKEHLQEHRIHHKTIPVYASWVGGVYERQVKTIKRCLHKSVGKAMLDYFELSTHLAEIQNVVNSRPITYVSSELNDLEPLTPNKILKVHTNPRLQMVEDPDDTDPLWQQQHNETHDQLNEIINRQEKMIDKYRKMWYSQYLLSLRETTRDVFQTVWFDKIAVGDVVLIDTKDRPRIYWQMGRVIQLIHGPDGLVRQVMVKTSGGVGRYSLRLLHPLEIQSTHTGTTVGGATGSYNNPEASDDQASDTAAAQPSESSTSAVRPKRDAAARQRQLVKDLIQTDSL